MSITLTILTSIPCCPAFSLLLVWQRIRVPCPKRVSGQRCPVIPLRVRHGQGLPLLWQRFKNFFFHLVRQSMAFANGGVSIDDNVKVYVETESQFADDAFV
jgi:hypothetical protein